MKQKEEPAYMAYADPKEVARLKKLRKQVAAMTKEIRRIANALRVRRQRALNKERGE